GRNHIGDDVDRGDGTLHTGGRVIDALCLEGNEVSSGGQVPGGDVAGDSGTAPVAARDGGSGRELPAVLAGAVQATERRAAAVEGDSLALADAPSGAGVGSGDALAGACDLREVALERAA